MRPMIIVTGGAGFIGSNIVARLSDSRKYRVVVCDRLRTGEKWRNIAKHELWNVVLPDDLPAFLDRHEGTIFAIIHMGAISSTTEVDGDKIVINNLNLTSRLWDWCVAHGTRFIYASSAATYGGGEAGFDDEFSVEALARLTPLNLYGWSKHAFDRRVAQNVEAGRELPPQWAGLKFFNVYGPNEYHKGGQKSVVAQIHPQIQVDAAVRLFKSHHPDFTDGGQKRDFVYVRDCVDVVEWLLGDSRPSGLFNLGTGKARTFLDLAQATFAAMGRAPNIKYVDTPKEIRDKYQYFTQANMDRLRAVGYDKPFTELEDGIADYVRTYLGADDPYL